MTLKDFKKRALKIKLPELCYTDAREFIKHFTIEGAAREFMRTILFKA